MVCVGLVGVVVTTDVEDVDELGFVVAVTEPPGLFPEYKGQPGSLGGQPHNPSAASRRIGRGRVGFKVFPRCNKGILSRLGSR